MRVPALRIRVLAATTIALVSASACAQTTVPDSPLAVALLRESAATARTLAASDSLRVGLLLKVAHAQVSAGDIADAMQTASEAGVWRRKVHVDAACRLLEDRRVDDAHAFVRRLPARDRDWALAHLASQLGRPVWSRRDPGDTVDTAGFTRRALGVVREVRAPEPRVDALISIGNSALERKDTATAAAAFEDALAQLARVHNTDFASSRRSLIAGPLGRTGRTDAALALARSLETRDRLELAWYMSIWRDAKAPRVRAELDSLIPLLARIRDPRARANEASGLVQAFRSLGDTAAAASLSARTGYVDPMTGRPWRWDDVSPTVVDRAAALTKTNIAQAIALVDTLDDPFRIGRRARAYLSVALALWHTRRDTIALLLRHARQAALDAPLTPERRDDALWPIASEQVERGFFDDAVVTIDAIGDAETASMTLNRIGETTFAPLPPHERRKVIVRLANADVRNQATAHIIEQTLMLPRPNDPNAAYVTALADSIPQGQIQERALLAIARHALALGDTAAARTRLMPLLAAHRVVPRDDNDHWRHDDLISTLIAAGVLDEVVAWARARRNPAERATALLDASAAIRARSKSGRPMLLSLGADMCRDEF